MVIVNKHVPKRVAAAVIQDQELDLNQRKPELPIVQGLELRLRPAAHQKLRNLRKPRSLRRKVIKIQLYQLNASYTAR